jgi:hypothetical protein
MASWKSDASGFHTCDCNMRCHTILFRTIGIEKIQDTQQPSLQPNVPTASQGHERFP